MSGKLTLHDVSATAKVSTCTASEATRQWVRGIAHPTGYVPNHHARSLKSPQSNLVAALTANVTSQYYAMLVESL